MNAAQSLGTSRGYSNSAKDEARSRAIPVVPVATYECNPAIKGLELKLGVERGVLIPQGHPTLPPTTIVAHEWDKAARRTIRRLGKRLNLNMHVVGLDGKVLPDKLSMTNPRAVASARAVNPVCGAAFFDFIGVMNQDKFDWLAGRYENGDFPVGAEIAITVSLGGRGKGKQGKATPAQFLRKWNRKAGKDATTYAKWVNAKHRNRVFQRGTIAAILAAFSGNAEIVDCFFYKGKSKADIKASGNARCAPMVMLKIRVK